MLFSRQFGSLARHSWGTLGAQNCISWGTVGAKVYLGHTWPGAHLGQMQLGHSWGTVETKNDLKHSFVN